MSEIAFGSDVRRRRPRQAVEAAVLTPAAKVSYVSRLQTNITNETLGQQSNTREKQRLSFNERVYI
jgi:hypothetical protein